MSNYFEFDDKIAFHPGYYIKNVGACHREQFVNNANDLNGIDILTNISYWS